MSPGLYWFHCDGPDGRCVLLVNVGRPLTTIVDDGNRDAEWPSADGWLHKWRPYHIEPVVRPEPLAVRPGMPA